MQGEKGNEGGREPLLVSYIRRGGETKIKLYFGPGASIKPSVTFTHPHAESKTHRDIQL